NKDVDMTDADQGGADQLNVSQESGFKKLEEDAHVTLTLVLNTQKTDEPVQSSYVSFDFTSKLLNLENPSLDENEIASLMETTALHKEPRSQTSSLYTVPVTATPKVTSVFTKTIPPPPPFFNPLPQQATPTSTSITYKATTSFPSLLDFSSVFKFNDRVTNLEKDLSEIKQVNQYAQALSSIPVIVDHYIDNKLREAIQQAIMAHNLDYEPSHTVNDLGVQHDQEFDTGNNDEQPTNKETWISQVAHVKEPRTSFDKLMDTSFDFSAFVLNWLNIKDLTQEILVGSVFELLKGTYKSLTELEYHLEECSKATTKRLD
nr:hypothetical protein [Tanacetum cinerariifolium]